MFKNQYFYHNHVNNAIAAFGVLFNNIVVKRVTEDNAIAQSIKVPLAYGPKQKFISRIADAPSLTHGRAPFEVVVPMMGFEITSFQYDPSRKLLPMQKVRAIVSTGGVKQGFVWTPYNIGVRLSILVKNQDDGFQIFEQIAPYFTPDLNIPINELPDLGVERNIQFVLDNVIMNDDYEGNSDKRLSVTWDLDFTIKINFFGFIADIGLIKEVIQNIYTDYQLADGVPKNLYAGDKIVTSTNPYGADPTGDFTYMQEFSQLFLNSPTPTTTTTVAPTTMAPGATTQAPTTTLAPTTTTLDPIIVATKMLIHMNGSNGSPIFIDKMGHPMLVDPSVFDPTNGPSIRTAQSKFGGASGFFNGSGLLLAQWAPDLDFGTNNFTIEFFINTGLNFGAHWPLFNHVDADNMINLTLNNGSGDGSLFFQSSCTSTGLVSNLSNVGGNIVNDNAWHHVAIVRNGTAFTMYVDGLSQVSQNHAQGFSAGYGVLEIGSSTGYGSTTAPAFIGYLDEFRIVNGIAIYTSNFTPPSAPFLPS